MALANINVSSSPAGTIGTVQTPVSQSTYTPAGDMHTFKVPVSVVFVTGITLVGTNNYFNGNLTQLWDLIYNDKVIEHINTSLDGLVGEVMFVVIVSFLAEINPAIADIAFALFAALWLVWAMNNTSNLNTATENIRKKNIPVDVTAGHAH